MHLLITGGNGFIGYNFILLALLKKHRVISLDSLSTSSFLNHDYSNLADENFTFLQKDIRDKSLINFIKENQFDAIVNFAAESHVDKSIHSDEDFISSNINGTHNLLSLSKQLLDEDALPSNFKFIQISTDEVYGSLLNHEPPFTEDSIIKPTNPYSASKASADFLCMSYFKTYGFPVNITRCSNNYGPFQYPEKLIPLIMQKVLNGKKIPIYGDGQQIRDWIYVEDHCEGILKVLEKGRIGEIYNFGGSSEISNIECVNQIVSRLAPEKNFQEYVEFVQDRPGHDTRYGINTEKALKELNWSPKYSFEKGISQTIDWYTSNQKWLSEQCESDMYLKWVEKNY